jgi:hypothetical protein
MGRILIQTEYGINEAGRQEFVFKCGACGHMVTGHPSLDWSGASALIPHDANCPMRDLIKLCRQIERIDNTLSILDPVTPSIDRPTFNAYHVDLETEAQS